MRDIQKEGYLGLVLIIARTVSLALFIGLTASAMGFLDVSLYFGLPSLSRAGQFSIGLALLCIYLLTMIGRISDWFNVLQIRYLLSLSATKRIQLEIARSNMNNIANAQKNISDVRLKYPEHSITILSSGRYLLTDRSTGRTLRELTVSEALSIDG